ncbi:MAG: DNA polymerase III subunit beta [Parcubacteria group bacterium CG10_big_fil_rev_8_21_14_0_10_36_14]|nr:MAG: DNA polymerase III subunit beta [Parcubacteria group bacterium CG10_big_fil_rev_8_21_14_0_10_36_14]
MKFVCTQENLQQGLLVASHINTKNINLPILNNVLLRVSNNTLKLISTNLEIAVTTKIRGKSEADGEYTVPAKLLADYVSLLPKENATLSLEDGFLRVSCGNKTTKIKGIDSTDFPVIPQIEKKTVFYIDGQKLRRALSQVSFAVLPTETRPEISGVFVSFNSQPGIATLVATDSFRLAEKKITLSEKSSKDNIQIIIPLKTTWELSNILSIISGDNDLLEVCVDDGQVFFGYNGTELTSRLIEGAFPDYQQIIPKEFNTIAKLSVPDLLSGAKSASLFSRSGLNDIKLNILPTKKSVEVYSTDNQTGEQKTIVSGVVNGKENKIVLNHRYLVDGLSNLGSLEATLETIDENSPCLIRPNGDNNYIYVVMPIKQ